MKAREAFEDETVAAATAGRVPATLPVVAGGTRRDPDLRKVLIAVDAAALAAGWLTAALLVEDWSNVALSATAALLTALICTFLGLTLAQALHLFRSRVLAIPGAALARWVIVVSAVGLVFGWLSSLGGETAAWHAVFGAVLTLVLVRIGAVAFESWLWFQRLDGRCRRRVLVVGEPHEVHHLVELFSNHPEIGYAPVGYVSARPADAGTGPVGIPRLGDLDDAVIVANTYRANGAVLTANLLCSEDVNRLTRELHHAGVHVHLSSGVTGIGHHRLRALPLAHEPLFYVEPESSRSVQRAVKRGIDVIASLALLLLLAPLLALTALLIKLEDRGPVLFQQIRIGRDGQPISIWKFRTMIPDAEQRRDEVEHLNQRAGPLFKADGDPRVTRVGRFLRATSIDELPQLWSVLIGDLSLVGPRPALPEEVARFDDELVERRRIPPGVTGLWQVEARHNPSFYAYRHLDLFYLENWSLQLDLVILLSTVRVLITDVARLALPARPGARALRPES